ncbi:hypothetical protein Pint_11747 [Pistacia integerrima]|uniref:Uncharacterized protein n=1 Tax=Pistacia integerrima TaxID=434235 RepID=A0ACC0XHS5_9ROSI|nr:hypothetical protein Pint_11747 [Pistacia integerrima]
MHLIASLKRILRMWRVATHFVGDFGTTSAWVRNTKFNFYNHMKSTYLKLAGTQGSFSSLSQPSSQSRNIAQLAKVKIMKKQGVWEGHDIPRR